MRRLINECTVYMAPSRLYGDSADFRLHPPENQGFFFKPRFCENIRGGLADLFGPV